MPKPFIEIDGRKYALNTVTPARQPRTLCRLAAAQPLVDPHDWVNTRSLVDEYAVAVKDQARSNTCVGQTLSEILEILWQQMGNQKVVFNPWLTYDLISPADNGASISDAFEEAKGTGCCPEDGSVPHRWMTALALRQMYGPALLTANDYRLEEGYHTPTWMEVMSAAQKRNPTAVGVAVGQAWERPDPKTGICPLTTSADMLGWHAVTVTQALWQPSISEWTVEFLNHWGNWGLRGRGYLRKAHFQEPVDAFAAVSMLRSKASTPWPQAA